MSEEPENKPIRIPKWLWAGSAFWLIGVFSFAWFAFWPNLTGGLKPNEFGDLLAGAFSPLAFAWFVYAVFMQRQELELQRLELAETRTVLKEQQESQEKSAISSKILAEQTEIQNSISIDSLRLNQFNCFLELFYDICKKVSFVDLENDGNYTLRIVFSITRNDNGTFIQKSCHHIANQINAITAANNEKKFNITYNDSVEHLVHLHRLIKSMNVLHEKGDENLKMLFNAHGFQKLEKSLNELLNKTKMTIRTE